MEPSPERRSFGEYLTRGFARSSLVAGLILLGMSARGVFEGHKVNIEYESQTISVSYQSPDDYAMLAVALGGIASSVYLLSKH